MKLSKLGQAKEYEEERYKFESKMIAYKHLRDLYINEAFNEGYRQKEIANALGLSESTIKHIIAKMKGKK